MMVAAPALWIWLAFGSAATLPEPVPAAPEAPEGPALIGEIQAGVNAPLGAFGFALIQPIWRLGIGAGIGMDLASSTVYQDSSRLRGALFVRAQLVDGPRFRLALGVGVSNMPELVERVEGDRLIIWQRQGQRRHDATLNAELPVGPLWLGMALGVAWVSGTVSCRAQNLTPSTEFPTCIGANGPPPTWIPFVALTTRRRSSPRLEADRSASPAPPPAPRELHLFLSGSTVGAFDILGESTVPDNDYGAGVEADLLWRRRSPYLRLGLGLRYEIAYSNRVSLVPHTSVTDHFLYLPFLLGLAARTAAGSEIDIQFGLGLAFGLFRPDPNLRGPAWEQRLGGMGEISIDYWTPITHSLDLSIGAAARGAFLDHGYIKRILPLRLGLRWGV